MTGVGHGMQRLENEIAGIVSDFPRFRFTFPNMDRIRKLDAETAYRKREMRKAREVVRNLETLDIDAITGLDEESQRAFFAKALEALRKGGNQMQSQAASKLLETFQNEPN